MLRPSTNNNTIPVKPTTMPMTCLPGIGFLKKISPSRIVKNGVSAFRMPARLLSSLVSAMQNKNAGKKIPSSPDAMI